MDEVGENNLPSAALLTTGLQMFLVWNLSESRVSIAHVQQGFTNQVYR